MYYKLIQNNKIIDVVYYPHFIRFLSATKITRTSRIAAQGVVGSDNKTLYSFAPVENKAASVVKIESISEEEFNRLKGLLNSGTAVSADAPALARAKQTAIKVLSNRCKSAIVAGFCITLSDGLSHRFALTAEDQLNLLAIENQLNMGVETFIYHATDEQCKVFNRDDMQLIVSAFRHHTMYHTSYFNAAKHYIRSLVDEDEVNKFYYGIDVSDFVTDESIKQLLKTGGKP